MNSSRPYLIRALYEWIADNDMTPYLLVDSTAENIEAPLEYADNGKLVLNVAPRAVRTLNLGNDGVAFNARFAGVSQDVWLPVAAILAIYARENGQGMLFTDNDGGDEPPPDGDGDDEGPKNSGPQLRVVK